MSYIWSLLFNVLVVVTIAFDPDGAAYGTQILGAVPNSILIPAGFFGNLLWVLGLFYTFGAVVLAYVSFNDEIMTKDMETSRADPKKWKNWGRLPVLSKLMISISIAVCLFAIGSGFWFYGTTWMFMIIAYFINYYVKKQMRTDLEAEVATNV